MPKSKTRKPAHRPVQDKPAALPSPEKALEMATLAITEASLNIVREAETRVGLAVREGDREKLDEALALHLLLRTASLGFLSAYSRLSGLPDPMANHPMFAAENQQEG